jgi:hypothetical protein
MKRRYLLSLIFIMNVTYSFAQIPDTLWTKTYGDSGSDGASGIVEVEDGFIITGSAGRKVAPQSYLSNIWIAKINENGETLWNKNYDGMGAGSILKLSESEFIVSAETFTQGSWENMMILKIDGNGDTIWTKTFLYPGSEYKPVIKKSNDNNIIILGYTENISPQGTFLIKLLESGDTAWTKFYQDMRAFDFEYDNDGDYLLLHNKPLATYISKLDSSGNLLMDRKIYDYSYSGYGKKIHKDTDGGFLVLGAVQPAFDSSFVWIYKLNFNLDSLWQKLFYNDKPQNLTTLINSNIGGYLIVGTETIEYPNENGLVMKIDESGNLLWSKTYGGEDTDQFYNICVTSDDGFIIAGATVSFGAGFFDAWLLRFEPEVSTNISSELTILKNYALSQNYPNPFNPSTTFEFQIPNTEKVVLKIYDVISNEVATIVNDELPVGSYKYQWNASGYASGVYFYKLQAGDLVETKKLILLR